MRRLACFLFTWVALIAPLVVRADDLLTMFAQARRSDPVLAAADAARRFVREGVALARAPLLPQLSGRLAVDQHRIHEGAADPADLRSRTGSASASVSQVLYDPAQRERLRAAGASADAQDARFRAAERALVARVARAYFRVLTAEDDLASVSANEEAFRRLVDQADQRYRQGLSALVALEQARAFHASARGATVAARRALDAARDALVEITGVPAGPLRRLRAELPLAPPTPADAQAWVGLALSHDPTLAAARAAVDAVDAEVSAARAGHRPTLHAHLGLDRYGARPQPGDDRTVSTVGLTLNVPLFAGGATEAATRQALHRRDGERETFEVQRRRLVREVLELHAGVTDGIVQIEAAGEAVIAAANALKSVQVGQQVGTQTMLDLLQAIQIHGAARGAQSQARHQWVLDRLLLRQAAGADGEAELAAINQLLE